MNSLTRPCAITRRITLRWIFGAFLLLLFIAPLTTFSEELKREPVESSVLASVGYNAKARHLDLEFHSGAIYRYFEVPEEIHRRLLAAESKGRFFGATIRDKFRSERVKAKGEK